MFNFLNHSSKPKTLQESKIFNSDATLLSGFIALGFLCQLWSFLSEFIGLNQYLIDMAALYMPTFWASLTGNGIALLLSITIEIATFAAITYIVNCIYNGYLTFSKNLTKVQIANWFKFLIGFGITAFIVLISITVSKRNIELQTKAAPPQAKIIDVAPLKEQLNKDLAVIENRYNSDKEILADSYNESKQNIISLYTYKIEQKESDIVNLERKEQRTGKKYITAKENYRKAIKSLREQQTSELITLKDKQDKNLLNLLAIRNNESTTIKETFTTDKEKITTSNDGVIVATQARNEWLSYFLKLYAGYSVLGFLFCRIWVVISFNTCGIQPRILVKPEFFESGILKDFFTLIYSFPARHLHNLIREGLATVPELVPISANGAVINIEVIEQQEEQQLQLTGQEQNEYNNLFGDLFAEPQKLNGVHPLSSNLDAQKNIFAKVELPTISTESSEDIFSDNLGDKNIHKENISKIGRIGDRMPLSTANLDNDRNKEKHKRKQKKRIVKYYENYIKKHGKKPSYQTISDALNIAVRSVGNYARELKGEGKL